MDLHFIDQNGNHFVVPDAPEGYERDDATLIDPPPSNEYRWIDGEWRIPEPEPEPAPQSCTRRQGRLALLGVGMLDAVEAAIAAIADPTERMAAQIEYEADTWERDNAFLQAMWAQLGGTEQQLDDLFREAVTL